MWFFKKNKKKNVNLLKWITKRSYFLWKKIIYFKKAKIIKINDIYKVSSFQILCYW